MSKNSFKSVGFVLMVCVGALGLAQTSPAQTTASASASAAAASMPATPVGIEVQHGSGGATFISGGAGDSERAAMDARRSEFPFKLVLSAAQGEYIVADTVSLASSKGEVLMAQKVGPLLMIKTPPGSYTLVVTYNGNTRRQTLKLGNQAKQVSIRFPG